MFERPCGQIRNGTRSTLKLHLQFILSYTQGQNQTSGYGFAQSVLDQTQPLTLWPLKTFDRKGMHKWGLATFSNCECDTTQETADHTLSQSPIHEAPQEMSGLMVFTLNKILYRPYRLKRTLHINVLHGSKVTVTKNLLIFVLIIQR